MAQIIDYLYTKLQDNYKIFILTMNQDYAVGKEFHFNVDTEETGPLFMDGKIVFNNSDVAVVQIYGMNAELDTLYFTRAAIDEIVRDFSDEHVNKELPHEEYAIIDAETGDFRYQQDIDTGEIEEI